MSDHRDDVEEEVEDLDLAPGEVEQVKGGDAAKTPTTSKPHTQDIHFTHVVDKSSPLL